VNLPAPLSAFAGSFPAGTGRPSIKERAAMETGRVPWRRSSTLLLLVTVFLVALADRFFYGHPVGWTVGCYWLALLAAIFLRGGRSLRTLPARLLTVAILGLVAAMIEEPGWLPIILGTLGIFSLALIDRGGWTNDAKVWLRRWSGILRRGWWQLFRDARLARRWRRSRRRDGPAPAGLWRRWSVPVVLSLVFISLFAAANPVISGWLEKIWGDLERMLQEIEVRRLLVWLLVGIWVWALLRLRPGRRRRGKGARGFLFASGRLMLQISRELLGLIPSRRETAPDAAAAAAGRGRFDPAALIVRCLLLFNFVFAVQSLLDIYYLWGGAELPAGMTCAEYAHRGAYPLVATALLAALFVLVTFRAGSGATEMLWARRLVYLWLAQNVFLTVSAVWRLRLYVEIYSLTRWRIAAAIWMLLVLAGLVWICLRILRRRSNEWLINVNLLTLIVVLYCCSFVNFDGFIADYNVRRCREVRGADTVEAPVDLKYLRELGPEALPALEWLAKRLGDSPAGLAAKRDSAKIKIALREDLADWRGWTYRRHRLAARHLWSRSARSSTDADGRSRKRDPRNSTVQPVGH